MTSPDYGRDFSCGTDLDPLLQLVEDEELMGQVCLRRLYCRKGSLLSNPLDNTLDARDFVNAGITAQGLPIIQGQCASALLGDPRVFEAVVIADFNFVTKLLLLKCSGTGSKGPFALTLAVSSLTVELLNTN